MPLYDFICESCGSFEATRHYTEAGQPVDCPECGKPSERQWSVPVVASNGQPTTFNARRPTQEPKPLPSGSTAFRPSDHEAAESTAASSDDA